MIAEAEEEWELVFTEQDDGRRVSRLPSGKVVLVDLAERDRVQAGEQWLVRVMHHEAYAIAHLVEMITDNPDPDTPPRRLNGPDELEEEEMLDVVVRTRDSRDTREPRETRRPRNATQWTARPDEIIRPGERVAVFVDGAVADQSCREAGYWFDYVRLLGWARGSGILHGGYYYATDRRNDVESQQQRFLDLLTHNGFIVHVKPPRRDSRGVAVEIAIDALDSSRSWDVAWFIGNDPDLSRLADVLRSRGKRVYALCNESGISRELASVVNKPIFNLEDHQHDLERKHVPKREASHSHDDDDGDGEEE